MLQAIATLASLALMIAAARIIGDGLVAELPTLRGLLPARPRGVQTRPARRIRVLPQRLQLVRIAPPTPGRAAA